MNIKKTLPIFLWILILISVGVRFVNLGAAALTENEAALALNALNSSAGNSAVYQNLSAGLFFVFASTNFAARFLIALASAFIVLSPFLFKKQLGAHRSLVLSTLLAISPLGLAAGRHINTATLVLAFGILLLWAVFNERPFWISFFAIGMILSGPEFYLFLAFCLLVWVFERKQIKGVFNGLSVSWVQPENRTSLLSGVLIGIFVFGLGLLTNPTGISAPIQAATTFIASFTNISLGGILIKILALPVYEPFLLGVVALAILIGGSGNIRSALLWSIVGLLILTISRDGSFFEISIVSFLVAIWVSKPLSDLWNGETVFDRETVLMLIFTFVVLIFAGLNFISALTPGLDIFQRNTRLIIVAFAILLLLISSILVSAGWSRSIAWIGLLCGAFLFLFVINISSFWKASGMFAQPTFELWDRDDPLVQDKILIDQIDEINKFNNRSLFDTSVEIVGVDSAALEWSLRKTQVEKIPDMKLSSTYAPFVVTKQNVDENVLIGEYRGQNIYWRTNADLSTMDMIGIGRWLVYREAPTYETPLILWTNSDQFPDKQNQ